MINFDADNIVIPFYPTGAGGKFLINCLGLSDNAFFQDSELVKLQLASKLSREDKFNLLINRLSEVNNTWNDLSMGCNLLLGVDAHQYLDYFNPKSAEELQSIPFDPIVETISKQNKLFFVIAHSVFMLNPLLHAWKNAKVILFKNSEPFIKKYDRNIIEWWAGFTLFDTEQLFGDLEQLPQETIDTLNKFLLERTNGERNLQSWIWHVKGLKMHDSFVTDFENQLGARALVWDTHWYLNKEQTVEGIRNLYSSLEFDDFNKEMISVYYDMWIQTLTKIKESHI